MVRLGGFISGQSCGGDDVLCIRGGSSGPLEGLAWCEMIM